MTLADSDHAAINRALENIYRLRDLDGFVVAAMKELPPLVDADISAYNEVDYAGRRMMSIIDSDKAQRNFHEIQVLLESIMNQNPLIEYSAGGSGTPKMISDFLTHDQWRATGIYQSIYGNIGGEFQLAVTLPVDDATIVAFAFNRAASNFTERHRKILTIMQPHLTRAYENARHHTRESMQLERNQRVMETIGAGWLDLDPDLRIQQAAPLASSILETFFDQSYPEEDCLPVQLHSWVHSNFEQLQEGGPVEPLVISNSTGRLIVRLLPGGDRKGCSLLMEQFLAVAPADLLERLGLTGRQAEVLYWVCQGKSNAEIAVILKISVRTVTFHISGILEALGVTNRTEAAKIATSHLLS